MEINHRRLVIIGTLHVEVAVPVTSSSFSLDIRQFEDSEYYIDEDDVDGEFEFWKRVGVCEIVSKTSLSDFTISSISIDSTQTFDTTQKFSALFSKPNVFADFVSIKFFDSNLIDDRRIGSLHTDRPVVAARYDDTCKVSLYVKAKKNLKEMRELGAVVGTSIINLQSGYFDENGFNGFISGKMIVPRFPRKSVVYRNHTPDEFKKKIRSDQVGTLIEACAYYEKITQQPLTFVGVAKDDGKSLSLGLETIASGASRNGYMIVPAMSHSGIHSSLGAFVEYMRTTNNSFYVGYCSANPPEQEVYVSTVSVMAL